MFSQEADSISYSSKNNFHWILIMYAQLIAYSFLVTVDAKIIDNMKISFSKAEILFKMLNDEIVTARIDFGMKKFSSAKTHLTKAKTFDLCIHSIFLNVEKLFDDNRPPIALPATLPSIESNGLSNQVLS